jgi:hypothetical protein
VAWPGLCTGFLYHVRDPEHLVRVMSTPSESTINNYDGFWLVQGQWTQQSYTHDDGETISDWVGLGCCSAPGNYLIQGGAYLIDPGCSWPWCTAPCPRLGSSGPR